MATLIQRIGKSNKYDAAQAIENTLNEINGGEWTYSVKTLKMSDSTLRMSVADEDGDAGYCDLYLYRNGDEVIAVPDFYLGEEDVYFTGSRGGEYILNGDDLEAA